MFVNTKFTKKHAPVFIDKHRMEGESQDSFYCMKPYIMNDDQKPPQTLIALDIFTVPREELGTAKFKTFCYDLDAFVCLQPEDVILLIRRLNELLAAIFEEENYRSVKKPLDEE